MDKIAIVEKLIGEVWNQGKLGAVDELLLKTCVAHDPLVADLRGPEAIKQFVRSFRSAFPDLRVVVDDIANVGQEVFSRWTATGTHRGTFQGMAATNRPFTIGGMAINRFSGSQIAEIWHTWDTLALMQQLGYLPTIDRIATGGVAYAR